MSTARGNAYRNRPQKHQNRTVFKNDLHDTSHKTKLLNSLQIIGVCKRCKDILDWKIKYKKYKPLTAPRKCVGCYQKTVKHAYHMLCSPCAKDKKVCAKCCKAADDEETVEDSNPQIESTDIKSMLKGLPERRRRTLLRYINKQQEENGEISAELISQIEDMVTKMDNINFEKDMFGDDFSDSDDDNKEG